MKPTKRGMVGLAALLSLTGCSGDGSATKAGGTGDSVTLRLASQDEASERIRQRNRSLTVATTAAGAPAVWRWHRTAGGDLRLTVESAFAIGNVGARALVSDPWKRIGAR